MFYCCGSLRKSVGVKIRWSFFDGTILLSGAMSMGNGDNIQQVNELAIFDRWGNQVFANLAFAPNQPRSGWDGRLNGEELRQDVYVYWAKVLFFNGKEKIFSGDVILLR